MKRYNIYHEAHGIIFEDDSHGLVSVEDNGKWVTYDDLQKELADRTCDLLYAVQLNTDKWQLMMMIFADPRIPEDLVQKAWDIVVNKDPDQLDEAMNGRR